MKVFKKYKSAIYFFLIIWLSYIFTQVPRFTDLKLPLLFVFLVITLGYGYKLYRAKRKLLKNDYLIYFLTIVVALLIGSTGWLLSPFFYLLYLLPIFISLRFSVISALAFVFTLAMIFTFNIGTIDVLYDFLIVLSFLSTVPIILYLEVLLKNLPHPFEKDN